MNPTQETLIVSAVDPGKNKTAGDALSLWKKRMTRLADISGVGAICELHEDFDVRIREMQDKGASQEVIQRMKRLKLLLRQEVDSRGGKVVPHKERKLESWQVSLASAMV